MFGFYKHAGILSSSLPCNIQSHGKAHFVTVPMGDTFYIYDCESIGLKFIGPHFPKGHITAVESFREFTYIALDSVLVVCDRAREAFRKEFSSTIQSLYRIGNFLFVLTDGSLLHFCIEESSLKYVSQVYLGGNIKQLLFPTTYVNKVLVLYSDSSLKLWNHNSGKLIYTFKDTYDDEILLISQTPVLDIVSIGLSTGKVVFHNLREDRFLFELIPSVPLEITHMAFRNDIPGYFLVADSRGTLSIWSLETKAVLHALPHVHDGSLSTLSFLPGLPVFLTTGASDNSIRLWIFDDECDTSKCRLLKFREGPSSSPHFLDFYGEDAHFLIAADGASKLWKLSLFKDSQTLELPTKKSKRYIPPVTGFSHSTTRSTDWDSGLSCHLGSPIAYTWNMDTNTLGLHELKARDGSDVSSVHVSTCGNWAFLGCLSGNLDLYNIQSGIYQRSFVLHASPIIGISLLSCNTQLITAYQDGTLLLSSFHDRKEQTRLSVGARIISFSGSGLFVLALDNNEIVLVSTDPFVVSRRFIGHSDPVLKAVISSDNKLALSISMSGTLLIWNVISGTLKHKVQLDCEPLTMALSPKSDLLAISFRGHLGAQIWANQDMYLPQSPENDAQILFASTKNFGLTISDTHTSSWQRILNLDLIKERNRPAEPPRAPAKVPFYLLEQPIPAESHEVPEDLSLPKQAQFSALIEDPEALHTFLKSLSPSAIDLLIRFMPEGDRTHFMAYLSDFIRQKRDFDIIMTFCNIFLRAHESSSTILGISQVWDEFEALLQKAICCLEATKIQ